MDNKSIIHLKPPTDPTDGATKKYVDDSIPDTSSFIKKDGSVTMTSNLNLGNKKINGIATPTSNTDAATKKYVDDNIVTPDLSDCLEKDGSVAMTGNLNLGGNKIVGLATPTSNTDAATKKYVDDNAGSPDLSDYLKKDGSVAMTGELNAGGYKYKMGINFYRLTANTDYTLCLEILNTDYKLWNKSQISETKELQQDYQLEMMELTWLCIRDSF
ncbi:unnamed protein product [Porites evermanni]|uniref:Uncharacterized protein n=1 Tax=Porites evermanni TaxID=104178 RepID=A0ABN8PJ19_9CNID|nr:unnamed protein product [Porites evermanni]